MAKNANEFLKFAVRMKLTLGDLFSRVLKRKSQVRRLAYFDSHGLINLIRDFQEIHTQNSQQYSELILVSLGISRNNSLRYYV